MERHHQLKVYWTNLDESYRMPLNDLPQLFKIMRNEVGSLRTS